MCLSGRAFFEWSEGAGGTGAVRGVLGSLAKLNPSTAASMASSIFGRGQAQNMLQLAGEHGGLS